LNFNEPLDIQQNKFPLGITKARFYGPGFFT
jgi:hypothetical protein